MLSPALFRGEGRTELGWEGAPPYVKSDVAFNRWYWVHARDGLSFKSSSTTPSFKLAKNINYNMILYYHNPLAPLIFESSRKHFCFNENSFCLFIIIQ